MRIGLAAGIVLAMMAGAAAAQHQCAEVVNDIDRLACFDLAYPTQPGPSTTDNPEWITRFETDPMSDAVHTWISVESLSDTVCYNRTAAPARLELFCDDGRDWRVTIQQPCPLGYDPEISVLTRFGDADPVMSRYVTYGVTDSFGPDTGGGLTVFLRNLLDSDRALFRIETRTEIDSHVIEFDTVGLRDAIEAAGTSCRTPE